MARSQSWSVSFPIRINAISILNIQPLSHNSERCIKKKCEYYFNVDSVAHLDNPHTLKLLIEQNRPVVAPMMVSWSLKRKSEKLMMLAHYLFIYMMMVICLKM